MRSSCQVQPGWGTEWEPDEGGRNCHYGCSTTLSISLAARKSNNKDLKTEISLAPYNVHKQHRLTKCRANASCFPISNMCFYFSSRTVSVLQAAAKRDREKRASLLCVCVFFFQFLRQDPQVLGF